MMRSLSGLFTKASLKHKLMIVTMFTTLVTLLIICSAFIAYDIFNVKRTAVKELNLVADIIAKRTAPALEFFGDSDQIKKNLSDLANKEEVVLACVYTATNNIVARYENANKMDCPEEAAIGSFFSEKHLAISRDIVSVSGNRVGGIYLLSDMREIREHLFYAIVGTFAVALVVFVLVYFLSMRFNRFIAQPIAELTKAASRIANEKNYKILAKKVYDDEIGDLATTFNRMIVKVRDYNEDLEALVEERTEELSKSLKTTERALDKAEKADRHKSEWIRNMSHEFRTPVHGILSFAKFGINDAENSKIPRKELFLYFTRIMQSTERLQYLVNGILDIAATESGKISLNYTECDLRSLAENVVKELSAVIQNNDLQVKVEKADFPLIANVDGPKIIQVITNLMGNAIKFSPKGSTVTVSFEKGEIRRRGGKVIEALRVNISDEGCGIPSDELREIFDPFKQSSKTDDKSGGTGLGLSISKNMIQAHGGKIWAENNPDKGARFSFIVPVE